MMIYPIICLLLIWYGRGLWGGMIGVMRCMHGALLSLLNGCRFCNGSPRQHDPPAELGTSGL